MKVSIKNHAGEEFEVSLHIWDVEELYEPSIPELPHGGVNIHFTMKYRGSEEGRVIHLMSNEIGFVEHMKPYYNDPKHLEYFQTEYYKNFKNRFDNHITDWISKGKI